MFYLQKGVGSYFNSFRTTFYTNIPLIASLDVWRGCVFDTDLCVHKVFFFVDDGDSCDLVHS